MHIHNGMPATGLGLDGWRKPWSGSNGGDCLEAKKLPGGKVALRQSTDPTGPAVPRAQLDRLIEAAQQPTITIQVLPLAAGLHPALYGPFFIFRFDAPELPDIVYGEHLTGAYYIEKPDETAAYIQALDRISAQAVPADNTAAILRTIAKEI